MPDKKISALGNVLSNAVQVTDRIPIVQGGVTKYYDGSDVLNRSGNIIFTSGAGIDFSAVEGANATVSILDDYEEGEWTAVLSDGVTTDAITYLSTGGGFYTRIGNMVTLQLYGIDLNASSMTGALRITGLPYPPLKFSAGVVANMSGLAIPAGTSVAAFTHPSSSYITLHLWDAIIGNTPLQAGEVGSSAAIILSLSYFVI